jgi:hypothetical protein
MQKYFNYKYRQAWSRDPLSSHHRLVMILDGLTQVKIYL